MRQNPLAKPSAELWQNRPGRTCGKRPWQNLRQNHGKMIAFRSRRTCGKTPWQALRQRSGTEVERKWNRSGTEVEQKWNRSGTEVEQKWNGSGTEVPSIFAVADCPTFCRGYLAGDLPRILPGGLPNTLRGVFGAWWVQSCAVGSYCPMISKVSTITAGFRGKMARFSLWRELPYLGDIITTFDWTMIFGERVNTCMDCVHQHSTYFNINSIAG